MTDGSSTTIGITIVAAVDQEVEPDAERQRERADGVLDHDVGNVERQRVRRCEHGADRRTTGPSASASFSRRSSIVIR